MKICTISRVVPAHLKGGLPDHVFDMARGLAMRGHEVRILTTSVPDGRRHESPCPGLDIHYLEGSESLHGGPLYERAAKDELKRLAQSGDVDVVHSQGHCGLFLLEEGARPAGVPCAISLHGTHWDELLTGWNLMRWGSPWSERRQGYRLVKIFRAKHRQDRKAIRAFDAVIATSHEQVELIRRRYGVPHDRLHLVLNGVDTSAFSVIPPYEGPPVVLCLARLICEKGVQFMLEALSRLHSRHPDLRLRVVGDGVYRDYLVGLTERLHIEDSVRFEGEILPKDLPECYRGCSIFANPTIRQNGYDLTILQGMAASRPVIASRIGSVPTAIEDGSTGLLIEPGNARSLAKAIDRLLTEPDLGVRLADAGRKDAVNRFSLDAMVTGAVATFESLLG